MGGRGSSKTSHNSAPQGYYVSNKTGRIVVIRNTKTGKGLPRRSAKKNAEYFGTDGSGRVNQLRIYDKNKNVRKDVDWNHSFDGNPPGTVHSHSWNNGVRSTEHKKLTPREIRQYKEVIEKATGRGDLKW